MAITDPQTFKRKYPLVNDQGNPMNEEPEQRDSRSLGLRWCVNVFMCWSIFFIVCYLLQRLYVTTCFSRYRELEMMLRYSRRRRVDFDPAEDGLRNFLVRTCSEVTGQAQSTWQRARSHQQWLSDGHP